MFKLCLKLSLTIKRIRKTKQMYSFSDITTNFLAKLNFFLFKPSLSCYKI